MTTVVVAWNSARTLPRCLERLRDTRWDGRLDLIVVDNGSSDGTIDHWDRRNPDVLLIETGRNLGFGAGVNAALAHLSRSEDRRPGAIALVNPDAFVDAGWLAPLVEALDSDPAIGAACPKILFERPDPHGRPLIQNVGTLLGPTWELHDRGFGEVDAGQYDAAEDVWGWCGGAVLLRRDYLDDVGRFDERLFLYAEDADLSWRGRSRGWRYRYVPSSLVWHEHRASSGGQRTPLLDLLNRRNRLVVVTRHGGVRGAVTAWTRALGGIVVALAGELFRAGTERQRPDLAPVGRRARAARDAARLLLGGSPPLPPTDAGPAEAAP